MLKICYTFKEHLSGINKNVGMSAADKKTDGQIQI